MYHRMRCGLKSSTHNNGDKCLSHANLEAEQTNEGQLLKVDLQFTWMNLVR